jgi:hypothetical protein
MDLAQLRTMGVVSQNPLVRREIKVKFFPLLPREQWKDPEVEERQEESVEGVVEVWLRKFSAADIIAIQAAERAGRDRHTAAIQRTTFNAAGDKIFPTEVEAAELNIEMFSGLLAEITKLNPVTRKKKSPPRTSSGVSSPSPSAAEA